jgi:hypothetical protein
MRRVHLVLDPSDPQDMFMIRIIDEYLKGKGMAGECFIDCPWCGWWCYYTTPRKARQGASAHVRQMHPDIWREIGK